MSERDTKVEQRKDQFTPEAYAARIRRRAARELTSVLGQSIHRKDLVEALIDLRHLRPGSLETAASCHKVLVKYSRQDLAEMGFTCDWFDLVQLVNDFLDVSDRWYHRGRWMSREEFMARDRVAKTV